VYGFAKDKRANIWNDELKVLKVVAEDLLNHSDQQLNDLLIVGGLVEVETDE
jgi:hypothetical protein